MKSPVINLDNKKAGEIDLDDTVFGLPVRLDILNSAVNWHLSKRHTGSHKTKERAEVKGVESSRRTKEADLQGSLGGGDPTDSQSESESLTELRNSDNQLYEALTLLRGINLLTPQAAPDNESVVGAEASQAQTNENGEA